VRGVDFHGYSVSSRGPGFMSGTVGHPGTRVQERLGRAEKCSAHTPTSALQPLLQLRSMAPTGAKFLKK